MMADYGMDVEAHLCTAPPGEEAFDFSHAGGEHEAFEGLAHQLADLTGQYVFTPVYHYHTDSTGNIVNTLTLVLVGNALRSKPLNGIFKWSALLMLT